MTLKKIISFASAAAMMLTSAASLPAGTPLTPSVSASMTLEPQILSTQDSVPISDTGIGSVDMSAVNSGGAAQIPNDLLSNVQNFRYYYHDLVYSESKNGLYFIKSDSVDFLSLNDGSCVTVLNKFDEIDLEQTIGETADDDTNISIKKTFVDDTVVYRLVEVRHTIRGSGYSYSYQYDYWIFRYDLDTGGLSCKQVPDDGNENKLASFAVDRQGRYYLIRDVQHKEATANGNGYTYTYTSQLELRDSDMGLLDTVDTDYELNSIECFDNDSGRFYFNRNYEWIYWGFSHTLTSIGFGDVNGGKLELSSGVLQTLGEYFYSDYDHTVDMVGKFLCADSPMKVTGELSVPATTGLTVYESSLIPEPEGYKLMVERDYPRETSGVFGSRAVSSFTSDRQIITVKGTDVIEEIDVDTGAIKNSVTAAYPIYTIIRGNEEIYAIERVSENDELTYYLQRISWKAATSCSIQPSTLTIDAGQFRQLELVTNGSLDETITWSSADPKVVSVNEDGQIYAVRGGTAVITARTLTGLSASVTVTVSDTPMRTRSGVRNNADGAESYNMLYTGDYSYPGSVICSYIGENADRTITRVAAMNESVTAETYSHDTTELKASKNIEFELPIFGGAFLGSENNFLVFGQENPDESDETEVVRVVKYTKDWTRVSAYSVYGANTYVPFEAGSLKMTECEGRLYIHTCHTMYAGDGDLHHQANMTFIINESDMSLIQSFYSIKNIYQAGYVSHSFDQFIRTDDEHVYRVDHGDAHLRGISITVADLGEDITKVSYILPFPFGSGTTHYNYTGAKVGGFELSSKNMIVAGASIDQENFDLNDPMNIFLSVTKKDFAHSSEPVDTIWLTEYTKDSGVSVSVPRLVKLNEESFLVMWLEETSSGKVTKAVTIDGSGNLTSDIAVIDATVTECQPIYCADGLVRWYGANNTKPVFYALNPYNLTAMEGSATDINIHVHRWEFHFKIEPDCFSSGYTLYYCPDCGEFKQDDYLPPKHSYKSKVIAPTYDSEGYTEHTCTVCGDTYYDNYKPMLPRTSITVATVKLSNATYTGKSLKPAPVVRMNGKTLVKGTDYTVKYSKNLNCGKAVVTISGKGAYTGTKTAGFIIKPAKAKLSAVKSPKTRQVNIAWKKSAGGVTGYQVVIATNSACTSGKKTYTIAKASTTAKTITKLKKGRTYYVKVRAYKTVGKTKYYGAYSTVKSVKCK